MKITMMRSRFQPFTKGHYEAIRSYYLYRKKNSDLPEKLVLCVIRDFDTVRMAQHRVGDKLVTGAETEDEVALIFRHLDFFNPFSAYEVIEQVQHSLHCFAAEDELTYQDPDYEKFVDDIMIVLCPLKFGELLEAVKKEDFAPRHLERHVNNIRNRVVEVLHQKVGDLNLRNELNDAFETSKTELMNNVLNTWARFIRDLLPASSYLYWLMPIFDQEDLNDFNTLKQMNFSAYYIIMATYNYECIPDLLGRGRVGLYGFFMQYILLLLVNKKVIEWGANLPQGWGEIISKQMDQIGKVLCSHCFTQYQDKVQNKLGFVSQTWDRLEPWQKELINSLDAWKEDYVSRILGISPEPYYALIALVNFLVRSQLNKVVKQILYPDPYSLENLDDQFQIPLETMSGTIAGWLRVALDRWRGIKLTNNQRKALAKVERLANTIEERNLEEQIRQDKDCLDDCRALARAARDLQVESVNKLTTRIEETFGLRQGEFWRRIWRKS
jgi:hypothetical protein